MPEPESRHKGGIPTSRFANELALKLLFQVDVGHLPLEEVLSLGYDEVQVSTSDQQAIEATLRGVLQQQAELDSIIDQLAQGWRVERLANVDKNVLRLAMYELTHTPKSGTARIIDQAVEMVKKFSTAESGRFVNGILGAFVRRRDAGEFGGGGPSGEMAE